MVFDMVLSSNSRSAEIPGTKGVTRLAFFRLAFLTLCALIVGIYILVFYPSDPAFLHTSAPAPAHRNPNPQKSTKSGTNPNHPGGPRNM